MSGLYSSGSGSGKLGFDSVGMIFVSEILIFMSCSVGGNDS